jgi:hypothetical protein
MEGGRKIGKKEGRKEGRKEGSGEGGKERKKWLWKKAHLQQLTSFS